MGRSIATMSGALSHGYEIEPQGAIYILYQPIVCNVVAQPHDCAGNERLASGSFSCIQLARMAIVRLCQELERIARTQYLFTGRRTKPIFFMSPHIFVVDPNEPVYCSSSRVPANYEILIDFLGCG